MVDMIDYKKHEHHDFLNAAGQALHDAPLQAALARLTQRLLALARRRWPGATALRTLTPVALLAGLFTDVFRAGAGECSHGLGEGGDKNLIKRSALFLGFFHVLGVFEHALQGEDSLRAGWRCFHRAP